MKNVDSSGSAIGERIKEARARADLSQAALAQRVGIKQPSLAGIEVGKVRNTKHLVQIASALGVDPVWLLTGQKTDASVTVARHDVFEIGGKEYTSVQRYDAGVSAGAGSLIDENAESLGGHLIETQWLRAITRAAPDNLSVVRCAGDSMENTLFDGDWILVDHSQKRFSREGIYTLQFEDFVWIKRVTVNLSTRNAIIISDNPIYPQQELPADEVRIIGRAIAVVARKL